MAKLINPNRDIPVMVGGISPLGGAALGGLLGRGKPKPVRDPKLTTPSIAQQGMTGDPAEARRTGAVFAPAAGRSGRGGMFANIAARRAGMSAAPAAPAAPVTPRTNNPTHMGMIDPTPVAPPVMRTQPVAPPGGFRGATPPAFTAGPLVGYADGGKVCKRKANGKPY